MERFVERCYVCVGECVGGVDSVIFSSFMDLWACS